MYNRRKRFITDSQPLHNLCDIPVLIYILAFVIFDRPFSSRNFLANGNWQHWLLSRVTCFFFWPHIKLKFLLFVYRSSLHSLSLSFISHRLHFVLPRFIWLWPYSFCFGLLLRALRSNAKKERKEWEGEKEWPKECWNNTERVPVPREQTSLKTIIFF